MDALICQGLRAAGGHFGRPLWTSWADATRDRLRQFGLGPDIDETPGQL
jgi:hypothetical protein